MKKILIILIASLSIILITFLGWYLFLRNPEMPVAEVVRNVLPFGSGGDSNVPPLLPGNIENTLGEPSSFDKYSEPTSKLFRISSAPVAGAVIFTRNGQPVVRYVDRATGHIYDVSLPTGASSTPLEKIKITNTTLPKIYQAYFRPDGNAVLIRSLADDSDLVENFSLTLTAPQSTSTGALHNVSSTALRGDIDSVATGPSNTLFYTLKDTFSVMSSAFNGASARIIFSSTFNDWRLASAGNNLVIQTKASASAPGYVYTLNTSGGALTKIIGPLNGLVATPNASGNRMLYSYVEGGRTKLFSRNLANNTSSEILPATLAEKCVWSVKKTETLFCGAPIDSLRAGEPDNWYKGITHLSDRIWLFDTNIDIAQILAEPKQTLDIDLDVSEPKLSPDENYLVFINKSDLSLWALRLEF
ncbi:MAG: hypothetical protein HYT68_01640 [Candidatus Zambryskibacteria bacterium]|nr:hypothetical protein [Candidatus Zambryskibacteria bacterium]